MAETVEYFMEEMVPELEDLEIKKIFNRVCYINKQYVDRMRLKKIVRQRQSFEYRLKRRGAKKVDFIRYAEYETNLEALRLKRKERLGIRGTTTVSDHSIVRRIYFILDRAVNKFKGDLQLWLHFIEFARGSGGRRGLSKLFAKALQLHPTSDELWTRAASWEYIERKDMQSARVLMQRALRLNSENSRLWLSYARIELIFVQDQLKAKHDGQQDGLSTAPKPAVSSEEDSDLEKTSLEDVILLEKQASSTITTLTEKEITLLATTPVLQVKIPRLLFENALKTLFQNIQFRLDFLHVYREFPGTEIAQQDIYDSLSRDFPEAEETHLALAERHFYGIPENDETALEKALRRAEKELEGYPFEQKANSLIHLYLDTTAGKTPLAQKRLESVLEKTLARKGRFVLREEIVQKLTVGEVPADLLYRILTKATTIYNSSVPLWKRRMEMAARGKLVLAAINQSSNGDVQDFSVSSDDSDDQQKAPRAKFSLAPLEKAIIMEYKKALETLQASNNNTQEELTSFYAHYLEWVERSIGDDHFITSSYDTCCDAKNIDVNTLLVGYLQYAEDTENLLLANKIIKSHRCLPGRSLLFFRKAIQVETKLGAPLEHIRGLFEDAVTLNPRNSDMWLDYIEMEASEKQTERVTSLYWRAARQISSLQDFEVEYNAIMEKL